MNGATANAPCAACTNTDTATMQTIGLGYEISRGVGNCSFVCEKGFVHRSGGCTPMSPVKLIGSATTYFSGLVSSTFDAYTIDPTTGVWTDDRDTLSLLLSVAAAVIASGNTTGWTANAQSCERDFANTPRYLTPYTGYQVSTAFLKATLFGTPDAPPRCAFL